MKIGKNMLKCNNYDQFVNNNYHLDILWMPLTKP